MCWLLGGVISGLINRGIRSDLNIICTDATAAAQTTGISLFYVRRRNEGNGTEDDGRKRSHTYIEGKYLNIYDFIRFHQYVYQ